MAINVDKESLEKALSSADIIKKEKPEKKSENSQPMPQISKEEEIGFHKGALNTLASERNELVKMIYNVESIMQAHLKRLEELGVKIEQVKKE